MQSIFTPLALYHAPLPKSIQSFVIPLPSLTPTAPPTGTLTHYHPLEDALTVPYAQYTSLPAQDRWMAHPTMPAIPFVNLWIRRYEKLIWMPVPIDNITAGNRSGRGKVEWYFTAETREEEEDVLDEDEEFQDDDGEDGEEEEEGEDDGEEEGEGIEREEVDDLWAEAYGEDEGRQRRDEVGSQEILPSEEESPAHISREAPIATERHLLDKRSWDAKTKEVYEIYIGCGWPSESFDRAKCAEMLQEFIGGD
ncbi:MAG: hypothetical protein Q9228_007593 [Teloschistes exilis]